MAFRDKIIVNPISGQTIRFLQTMRDTNGQFLEMEATYTAHSKVPARHFHPFQEETFIILSGNLKVQLEGHLLDLKKGDKLNIPRNKVHAMWNDTNEIAIVNWKVEPAMNTEHLLETTFGLVAEGKINKKILPNILQVALIANRYNKVFRLKNPPFIIQQFLFLLLAPFGYLLGYKSNYARYVKE
ncbi:cupin domain-containing protein [Pedobacter yonginense]|uniref:Cupin domain-containing protein n=1 Tax=Pedobacter yonginense TaxID=651869 RepID=A0A317EJ14_9SPHI|nr:cupin domain-containing protein [Pedobacter yonginense]PWS26117.1 cupin domain-containing protein [Pedobacter yonginense]